MSPCQDLIIWPHHPPHPRKKPACLIRGFFLPTRLSFCSKLCSHFMTHLSPFFAALSAAAAKLIFTPSSPACPGGRKEVFVLCWCVLYLIIDASMIIILTLARRVQPFVWNHIKITTSAYFVLSRPSWHFYCRRCSKARLVQRCPKACRRWHWPGVPGAD